MKLKIILFFLLLSSISAAQVNTERLRKNIEDEGWSGNVNLALGLTKGNSEFVNVKNDFRIDYATGLSDYFLAANYEFKQGTEKKIVNKGFAHLRAILPLSNKIFFELFTQKEFNEFILLKDRNIIGSGLRFNLTKLFSNGGGKSQSFKIYLGSGVMFENEVYKTLPETETSLFRSTNYLTMNWDIADNIKLLLIGYFQSSLERISDHRYILDSQLSFKITDALSFLTELNYRFDNEPLKSIKKYDLNLNNGISYQF